LSPLASSPLKKGGADSIRFQQSLETSLFAYKVCPLFQAGRSSDTPETQVSLRNTASHSEITFDKRLGFIQEHQFNRASIEARVGVTDADVTIFRERPDTFGHSLQKNLLALF